jgi:hypothetical protein
MGDSARPFIRLFPQEHIPIVVTSLIKAGEGLKKKTHNDFENWITRRLYRRAIRLFPFRDGPLDIRLQPEIVADDNDDGASSGQIDLLVSCGLGAEAYFAIEAKRLRVRLPSGKMDAGNDDYINYGMMRFVSGQYAPYMKTGAMLGYVYDGDIKKARNGVARYILKKEKELKLIPPKRLARSEILPDKRIDKTRHALKNRIFTIYHVLLNVM